MTLDEQKIIIEHSSSLPEELRGAMASVEEISRFENEFGEIGVDEKIIPEAVDEEVIEVMNGCICCTVRGDLVEALKRLHKRMDKFDGVIIETTGLADPAPVVQTFFVDEGECISCIRALNTL